MTNRTPNAYVLIHFTANGPKNVGTFSNEAEARAAYDALDHGMLAAQFQLDPMRGASAGQNTLWNIHK